MTTPSSREGGGAIARVFQPWELTLERINPPAAPTHVSLLRLFCPSSLPDALCPTRPPPSFLLPRIPHPPSSVVHSLRSRAPPSHQQSSPLDLLWGGLPAAGLHASKFPVSFTQFSLS